MAESIFGKEVSAYWDRNLPVIPVDGKVPIPLGWTGFLGGIPGEDKRAEWLTTYASANIGLLLGAALGPDKSLVALDVDDDRLVNLVLHLLGLNRAERRAVLAGKRGKKGATIFVGAPKSIKSTVIKGAGGLGNIDFLAGGRMTVMPPSIHPDTGNPYEVFGEALLEVDHSKLPEIGLHHIKLLKATIGSEHASVLITGDATHDAGVALVATLVHAGATDAEIIAIITGLLPGDYSGDSLKELPEWIKSAREKGFDAPQADTNSLTKALVSIAMNSGIALFNDGDGNAYATLPHLGEAIAVRIESSAFSLWLRHRGYIALERPVSSGPLKECVATLEAHALFEAPTCPVYIRVAGDQHRVVVDLGQQDGRAVNITHEGWEIAREVSHKFVRGAGFGSMPIPSRGGDLSKIRSLLGLDAHNYRLLVGFLINALRPQGPYFILLVEGEQGSGKSFFCEVVKRIIDPNKATRLRLPDKPQDLMIQAKEYRLLSFDNASSMTAEMSDALCLLATGGGIAVRKLYSDSDLHVMSYSRPFVLNGIAGYASRPDLMERAIPIKLLPMPEGTRKTEAELLAEFEQMLPGILGALYSGVSHALRIFDSVEPPRHLRMADAARWIKAAEGGLGEEPGAIIEAIAVAQNDFVVERINDDPLVVKLRAITRTGPFEGYMGDLFVKITEDRDRLFDKGLPQTSSILSRQLARLRPAMAKAGVFVEFLDKDRLGRKIRVTSEPNNFGPPKF